MAVLSTTLYFQFSWASLCTV